ncbi:glycosyl hydrolase [Actinoplanes sp. NPDC026623]|uniref:glycosyl hydrolase n=1 Tax=Actinoplanes sp. NPDC026623 TaxID=3155610 RepID=UPI0033E939D3
MSSFLSHPRRWWRRRAVLAAPVAAALVTGVLVAVPASAAVGSPLVGAASGRCLDVLGGSNTQGAAVGIYDCQGSQNQGWVFTGAGELRTFNETACLDAPVNAAAGAALVIWPCNGGQNQKFRQHTDGSIVAAQTGLCLDVNQGATANETRVILWACNGQANQRWSSTGTPTIPPPGNGTCDVAPVDPQASRQARNLLCYLYSQYGNHILSGQRETNGREDEFNHIRTTTGKYPAIRGLDMCDRPGAISRAAAWWNAGGIPLIGWHVGAPGTGRTCDYAGSTSINAVLTPGTNENRAYLAELDAAAGQLAQLQSQGVAVLWAPYHEAGGTWFWWSTEGGSQYQRLWRYQFDYFTKTKGVHNLVWLHPYNGSPQSSFYPGKQYVDVGGADTYVSDHGPLTSLYNSTRAIVGGTVPIALHENGAIPDPDQLQSSGARWVTFNTWNGDWLYGKNDAAFLRKVYTHNYVVTRDEVPSLR